MECSESKMHGSFFCCSLTTASPQTTRQSTGESLCLAGERQHRSLAVTGTRYLVDANKIQDLAFQAAISYRLSVEDSLFVGVVGRSEEGANIVVLCMEQWAERGEGGKREREMERKTASEIKIKSHQ